MLTLRYNARALELSELCAGIFLQIIHYQLRLSCGHLAFAVDTFTGGCLAAGVQKLHEFVCLHVLAVRKHDRYRILLLVGVAAEGMWFVWVL